MEHTAKQELSRQLQEEIAGLPAIVLIGFAGTTVEQATELRNRFRAAGCTYRVYKNSTIRWAVKGTPHEPVSELLSGMNGLAYHAEDPGAPARVVREYGKEVESLKVKGGVIEGALLDEAAAFRLADMPGPRELKSMLLSVFSAPASQMVRVLAAAPQSFLNLLNAKRERDEAA